MRRGLLALLLGLCGCSLTLPREKAPAWVTPAEQPGAKLDVPEAAIPPMYREVVAVDLTSVVRVALARNLDLEEAREQVAAARSRLETGMESTLPVFSPRISSLAHQGANLSSNGSLVIANFTALMPAAALGWIMNPGQAIYAILAAKRRLRAAARREEGAEQEAARRAALQYYDLALARARVGVARQAIAEAAESLRVERVKFAAGTGLPVDTLRAEAAEAQARQQLINALAAFYKASVALSVTLDLDPAVMLVPHAGAVRQRALVREGLPVERMLAAAVRYRPDLAAVRAEVEAARADKGSALWGALGPQFQASYTEAGLSSSLASSTVGPGLNEDQRIGAGAGFALGLSTLGRAHTAEALARIAGIGLLRGLEQVRAQVVRAHQAALQATRLIPLAQRETSEADEALRLAVFGRQAGTVLLVDVLQAEAAADQARLRYASAIVGYNQAEVNLLAALGLIGRPGAAALVD